MGTHWNHTVQPQVFHKMEKAIGAEHSVIVAVGKNVTSIELRHQIEHTLARPGRKQEGTRAISTTSRRELSSSFFFLQGKPPKEIHAILTETLACFLPGRAKNLSAPLYKSRLHTRNYTLLIMTTFYNQLLFAAKSCNSHVIFWFRVIRVATS